MFSRLSRIGYRLELNPWGTPAVVTLVAAAAAVVVLVRHDFAILIPVGIGYLAMMAYYVYHRRVSFHRYCAHRALRLARDGQLEYAAVYFEIARPKSNGDYAAWYKARVLLEAGAKDYEGALDVLDNAGMFLEHDVEKPLMMAELLTKLGKKHLATEHLRAYEAGLEKLGWWEKRRHLRSDVYDRYLLLIDAPTFDPESDPLLQEPTERPRAVTATHLRDPPS